MRGFPSLRNCVQIDENAPILDFHGIGRNAILLEAGLADSRATMEFPIVPGTDDIFAVQPALAQRAADMVAGVGNYPDFRIPERNGELHVGPTLTRRSGVWESSSRE
jgi:hypothetical protein